MSNELLNDPVIQNAIDYVHDVFRDNAGGHDAEHTMRVLHNTLLLARLEEAKTPGDEPVCDLRTAALAALLHDVDDRKLFHSNNNENARRFLEENRVPPEQIEEICDIVNSVSFSLNKDKKPETIEAKIVQDADRLDSLGAIGIARTFAYGGEHGRSLKDSVQHFYDKLLLLKGLMNTESAREMAEKRHRFLKGFLEELKEELTGGE